MIWAHFLHIYQPADQHPGTLEKIVNESYRPILRGLFKLPKGKITLNVNAVLTEMLFEHGYRDVIDDIKALVEMNRIELTGSAKFHAFLPLIPENEIKRQIELNHETNLRYFGDIYKPQGFFSPEMAYSPKVAEMVKKLGYKWILADESSLCDMDPKPVNNKIFEIEGVGIDVYFREKKPTNVLMGALVRSVDSMRKVMSDRLNNNEYVITAMDGETFGHHRPGLEEALFELLKADDLENIFISELPNRFPNKASIIPKDSTWASSYEDVKNGNPFTYWFNKHNKIHELEWDLADIAIRVVNNSEYSDEKYPQLLEEVKSWEDMTKEERTREENKRQWIKSRDALDKALNSDPWWWACAIPWWSVEMIEKGMNALYKVVLMVPDSSEQDRTRAEQLYLKILFTAHEWQRTGKVDVMAQNDSKERRIPMSKRFGATAHYKALLKALREQEERASKNREYEQAIKWRDGQYKLERDNDIYDAIHIMDLFRNEGDMKVFEKYLEEYRREYDRISRGQPE